jgi:hypothetical protein
MMEDYNDDGSYLKKDMFGYSIIYPYKNNDGSLNWFNIWTGGSWAKLIVTLLIVSLIIFSVYAYKTDVKTCYEVIENPCDYCNLNPTMINTNLILPDNIYINSSSSQVAFIRENERGVTP